MGSSQRALMEQLIDYAGLFPPAELPLDTAMRNYVEYGNRPERWVLGKFIVPAYRLPELEAYLPFYSHDRPLTLSVLGTRSGSAEECLAQLDVSFRQMALFREMYGEKAQMDVFELPLPPVVIETALLNGIAAKAARQEVRMYCEMTYALNAEWESHMLKALDAISAHNASGSGEWKLGVKLRTGGVTASAFPSPRQVAVVLAGCRDRKLPLKFTAGLHHPVRMYRSEVSAKMHGFLNVFVAGLLAYVHGLDVGTIEDMLSDEKADHFYFAEHNLGWQGYSVSVDEVMALRKNALFSYGSCSFEEPCNELRELYHFAAEE